jgi:CDP-glucose 4,6-dehydratase
VGIATARAGNVIGGGDAAADRLIPDLVRSAAARTSVAIRYPRAVRPWQHVVDPLRGYLMLAEALARAPAEYTGAWNFGPDAPQALTVVGVAERFIAAFGRGARWHLAEDASLHEAATLELDSSRARERLGWRPLSTIDEAIAMTADGYRALVDGDDVCDVLTAQIDACSIDTIAGVA